MRIKNKLFKYSTEVGSGVPENVDNISSEQEVQPEISSTETPNDPVQPSYPQENRSNKKGLPFRLEKAFNKLNEKETENQNLRQQNEELSRQLELMSKMTVSNSEILLTQQYETLIKEAHAQQDFAKATQLSMEFAQKKSELEGVKTNTSPTPSTPKENTEGISEEDKRVLYYFQVANPWYGVDAEKTRQAAQLDVQLMNDPNFASAPLTERLKEVLRRMSQGNPFLEGVPQSAQVASPQVNPFGMPVQSPSAPIGSVQQTPGQLLTPEEKRMAEKVIMEMNKMVDTKEKAWEMFAKTLNEERAKRRQEQGVF